MEQFLPDPSQQQVQAPAGYNFQAPQFEQPQPVGNEFIPTGFGQGAMPTPEEQAAEMERQRLHAEQQAQQPMPDLAPAPPAGGGTAIGAPQPPQTQPPVPATTPPNPASPTVPGMPNQATPGWQGHKPEFLPTPPPNMPGPAEWTVDDRQTVLGQMRNARLSPEAAPLYERMRQAVVRGFLAKGGKNSMRAHQAAEMVVVETAFKIGAADAQVYARSAEFNAAMKNQFSAAEQRFMHEAMLSDQNFQQAKTIQQMQIDAEAARAAAAAAQISMQNQAAADMFEREQANWIERATISHGFNLEIIGLQNTNQRGILRLQADLEGGLDDRRTNNLIRRDDNLTRNQLSINREAQAHELTFLGRQQAHDERMSDLTYRQNWSLNEQRQGHGLEMLDRQTDNAIRERGVAYGHQLALNYQSEVLANMRNGNSLIAQILSTPGLSGAQQQAAIRTIGQMTATSDELIGSFYANLSGGGAPGGQTGGSGWLTAPTGTGAAPSTGAGNSTAPRPNPYSGGYSNYQSLGNPYVAAPAPDPGAGGATIGGSLRPPTPTAPPPPGGG